MSHSYTGPSGRRYHLNAEGSVRGDASFLEEHPQEPYPGAPEGSVGAMIPMQDVLFLAALHVRSVKAQELENASDLAVLGLEEAWTRS